MKRENTISSMVLGVIKDRNLVPSHDTYEIANLTGLKATQVQHAVLYLRRIQLLPAGIKGERSWTIEDRRRVGEQHDKTWRVIKPLVARNAAPFEIVEISGLRHQQIYHAVERQRKFDRIDEYFTPENIEKRSKRVNLRRSERAKKAMNLKYGENYTLFAKKLFENNLIPEEKVFWNFTMETARRTNRSWEINFPFGLMMEVYMIAKFQEARGKDSLMKTYIRMGENVDKDWFNGARMWAERSIADSAVKRII